MTTTFELIGTTSIQRSKLKQLIGSLLEFERLDPATWNATVPDDRADDLTDWADRERVECRLV